ncbi:hypothetical protein AX16_000849 [Volvariella volvacea WC 439]|nr:hypothetical protein AX16_000849 [Volvariella volvacea WC 439]
MLFAAVLLAVLVHSLAAPIPMSLPDNPISTSLDATTATLTASQCSSVGTRSTLDIVYNSILIICLWTYISLHHNIPDRQVPSWKVASIRVAARLHALFAPEFIFMWALQQRINAVKVAEQNQDRGWTKTHGFFVQMGGLMQRKGRGGSYCFEVVTSDELEGATIPYISEKEIRDRGKGNSVLMLIALLQTIWFVTQCITRYAHGLVITSIELVALANVTLNIFTYILWWGKPFNARCPIFFDEEGRRVDGPKEVVSEKAWYQLIREKLSWISKRTSSWSIALVLYVGFTLLYLPYAALLFALFPFVMLFWALRQSEPSTSVFPLYIDPLEDEDLNRFLLGTSVAALRVENSGPETEYYIYCIIGSGTCDNVGVEAADYGRKNCGEEQAGWTRTHGFFVQMGGLMQCRPRTGATGGFYYQVMRPNVLDDTRIPYIPEREIKDHGKGDILAKAIVVVQTTWFIMQCMARLIKGLALTEIELVALAFAVLNAITYGLWWDKPLNIEYPIYFDENERRVDGPEETEAWYEEIRSFTKDIFSHGWIKGLMCCVLLVLLGLAKVFALIPVFTLDMATNEDTPQTSVHPFYAAELDDKGFTVAVSYASTIGMVFGGIHLIGWNFAFPTATTLWMWRSCSLALTFAPPSIGL